MAGPQRWSRLGLKTSLSGPCPLWLSRAAPGQTRLWGPPLVPCPAAAWLLGTGLRPAQLAAAEPAAGFRSLTLGSEARLSQGPGPASLWQVLKPNQGELRWEAVPLASCPQSVASATFPVPVPGSGPPSSH